MKEQEISQPQKWIPFGLDSMMRNGRNYGKTEQYMGILLNKPIKELLLTFQTVLKGETLQRV